MNNLSSIFSECFKKKRKLEIQGKSECNNCCCKNSSIVIEFEEDNATEYTATPIDAATTPTNANMVYYTPVPITATATATATATLSPMGVQGGVISTPTGQTSQTGQTAIPVVVSPVPTTANNEYNNESNNVSNNVPDKSNTGIEVVSNTI